MVLRKQPPPRLDHLAQGNHRPGIRSPTSPTAKSASPVSPKRLTRPKRAQSTPEPRLTPFQEPVYSPDLNTSPAFDLMPIEQAQRSPPGTTSSDSQNPWNDDWVDVSSQVQGYSDPGATSAPSSDLPNSAPDSKGGNRVPSIVVAGTQRRLAANDWQNDSSGWEQPEQQPVQLRSNNPFLRTQQSEHNPWGGSEASDHNGFTQDARATSFARTEGSDRLSQSKLLSLLSG